MKDVELLADLSSRTFEAAYSSSIQSEDLKKFIISNFSSARIKEELTNPDYIFLLGHQQDEAIGYALLRGGTSTEGVRGRNPVELGRIYLDEKAIGLGFGSELMSACLDVCRSEGYQTIWLGVWDSNERAIAFYERWGFKKVGVQEFAFGDVVHTDQVMVLAV
jgi:ribosomal protein S18 acetylase RimI-like enzyme